VQAKPGRRPPSIVVSAGAFVLAGLLGLCGPAVAAPGAPAAAAAAPGAAPSTFSDFRSQCPGAVHRIQAKDLPPPGATESVDNGPTLIPRPKDAWPQAPAGFKVELYAGGLENPRLLRTAPNGDVFLAESKANSVRVFRGVGPEGKAKQSATFARGLRKPFGLAFYPPGAEPKWLYVANTDAVVRFPYVNGQLQADGKGEPVVKLPGGGLLRGGGHWTRDLAFSRDGKTMYVSVGSHSNNDDSDGNPTEFHRACILAYNPDGSGERLFASGIRNPVGIAIDPRTGALWTSVNERDELGDNLVPDYVTRVKDGGFYGWPWFYIGANQDPKHRGKHPELRDKVSVPDVLLQPHNASLELTFYEGAQFPAAYRGDIFAAEHGSWNRANRTGYEVIRVPSGQQAAAGGGYEDFLTGFVTAEGKVWGRPVGVTVAADGALLVSDDGSNAIWRVSYAGK
jgi:glucose/arabinose dehydrogenase